MLLDEFAHTDRGQYGMGDKIWSSTTKTCRLRRAVSTPNGRANKFAGLRFGGSLPVFTVRWEDDPAKTVHAYVLDRSLEIGPVTVKAGSLWSPWAESTRKSDDNDSLFAQEVLLSYEGLGGSFYDAMLPRIRHEQVKDPVWVGHVKIADTSKGPRVVAMQESSDGFLKLWEPFTFDDGTISFPTGLYCNGIDVASGSRDEGGRGASNSVSALGRLEGRRVVKIAQYMTHGLFAHKYARVACALGWLFRSSEGMPAHAIWERNGPGELMGSVLMTEHGYPGSAVYWETGSVSGMTRPGFQMQATRRKDGRLTGSRVNVFNSHKEWLDLGDYCEPSIDTYREMEQYRTMPDGGAEHIRVQGSLDPGEGRTNHGDTVIATVLLLWYAKQLRELGVAGNPTVDPPKMSMAWAQKRVQKELSPLWR
jgi:hypothetical protein